MTVLEIARLFSRPFFSVKDTGLTYRTINHYEEKQLFTTDREQQSKWRKFNGFEMIWIKTIEILRKLGSPIKNIQELRGKIHSSVLLNVEPNDFNLTHFEFEVTSALAHDQEKYLVIYEDLSISYYSGNDEVWNTIFREEAFLCIPLGKIAKEIYRQAST